MIFYFGIFIEGQLVIKKKQRFIIKRECGIFSMIRHSEYITMIYDIKQHIKKVSTTGGDNKCLEKLGTLVNLW